MPRGKGEETGEKPKNIKNIYVQKIHSLMKISRDNLADEQPELLTGRPEKGKKIKKTLSEMDKTKIKQEKNRQSARKARQRKNLYIQLLEKHVQELSLELEEGAKIERESQLFYEELRTQAKIRSFEVKEEHEDDLDKYLSKDDLGEFKQDRIRKEKRKEHLTALAQEIGHLYEPEFLHNFHSLSQSKQEEITIGLTQQFRDENPQNPGSELKRVYNLLEDEEKKIFHLTERLSRIADDAKRLVEEGHRDETLSEIGMPSLMEHKIGSLIASLGICGVEHPPEDLIQRVLRFSECEHSKDKCETFFMRDILKKLIVFDRYTQKFTPGLEKQQLHEHTGQ